MPSVDLPVIGRLVNTNELLGTVGVNGIKTGTTDEAGACLLFSATLMGGSKPVTVIGVFLGGVTHEQIDNDIERLIASIAPAFREVQLTKAGQDYGSYTTAWGQTAALVSDRDSSAVVWSNTPISVSVQAQSLQLASVGEIVGAVTIVIGNSTSSVPLILNASLTDPGPWWHLTHPGG
jgi:D-alanyl-D-alanine carboxypeptidase (penicillin-binding protein 5/6)